MDIDVSREQQAAESRQAQIDFVYQSVAGLCNLEHRLIGDPTERMKEIFVARNEFETYFIVPAVLRSVNIM